MLASVGALNVFEKLLLGVAGAGPLLLALVSIVPGYPWASHLDGRVIVFGCEILGVFIVFWNARSANAEKQQATNDTREEHQQQKEKSL